MGLRARYPGASIGATKKQQLSEWRFMSDQLDTTQKHEPSRNQLWDVIQTFSDEAQNAAKRKASEQGYSLDRAEIPFEDTLINLSHCRDVLVQAIESTAIVQLPLKIQRQM